MLRTVTTGAYDPSMVDAADRSPWERCPSCHGQGFQYECDGCKGRGIVDMARCAKCQGRCVIDPPPPMDGAPEAAKDQPRRAPGGFVHSAQADYRKKMTGNG